ncbi:MAG: hypothetical protein E7231_01625 [Cellulosilyticum sp.]|jgi:hypothetical protein|nr:hypothetical protein [Cellulosilyticum sp.]
MQKNEFTRIINGLDVYNMKAMGCHIDRHLNMTDSDLIHRVTTTKTSDGNGIYGASTFILTEDEVVEAAKLALLDYADELVEWLNDYSDGDSYVAEFDCDKLLGHGFYSYKWHNWNDGACECHRIVVVLAKAMRKDDMGFKFVTCYCEPTDEDIENCKAKKQ